jgi:hypothetical protein
VFVWVGDDRCRRPVTKSGLAVPGTGSSTILPAVEQRIGTSSQPLKGEPVTGAGFDPAFIPGLTAPASAEPEDAGPVEKDTEEPAQTASAGKAVPEEADDAEEAEADETPEAAEGPVFEAADRRARILADHRGIRLSLDDQECEFRWDEIGAVETETPRFGKRFTVTVHTPERRWYPIEIEASSRARFAEWEQQLDAVLDTYFEDGAADEDGEDGANDEDGKNGAADVREPENADES